MALVWIVVQAASSVPVFAATFTVTKTADTNDGTCNADCSLREAIVAANATAGADTIVLASGLTYTLTLGPFDPAGTVVPGAGDLDITQPLIIEGNGSIVDAGGIDRAFDIQGVAVTINNLTIKNGAAKGFLSLGGGLIVRGGSLTLNNCTVTANSTVVESSERDSGGGIAAVGSFNAGTGLATLATLTLSNTTVSGNTGSIGGGILCVLCTLVTTNATITGNTAIGGDGGGIALTGNASTASVTGGTLTLNTASGGGVRGGALSVPAGTSTSTITRARILSNTGTTGSGVFNNAATINAVNNWWGCNYGPGATGAGCSGTPNSVSSVTGTTSTTPFLVLNASASPAPILPGQTSTLTADLTFNSAAADTSAGGTIPNGTIASFAATLGTFATASSPIASGKTTDLYTAGGAPGTASLSVTVDAQTVATPLNLLGPPTIAIDRTALTFSAVTTGIAFTSQTGAQTVHLTQTGPGTLMTWTASSNAPWLVVSPASGSGPGALTVTTQFVPGLNTTETGAIAVTLTGAANAVGPIAVTLRTVADPTSIPFGVFDTPAGDGTVLAGSVPVTGWALDNIGVDHVEIWRDLQAGETTPPFASTPDDPRNGKVFIGNATLVDGARPDVEALYPTTPFAYRAGWGYLMLTWGLNNEGNGTYNLYAYAFDKERNIGTLGSKTIVVSNAGATRPFGSIDTPSIGGTPAAGDPNFGWALTPKVAGVATCKIPPSGVQVSIDSGPLQPVSYGDARTDVAGAFTGFSNSTAAGGHFIFDWTTLANGTHTIAWLVTDDCNRADGVGSRFFNVTGGTSLLAGSTAESLVTAGSESSEAITVAYGFGELPRILTPGDAGSRIVDVKQGERIEIRLPRGFESVYQLVAGQRRALPIGATWDAAGGTFAWQPAAGFLGPYRFVFTNGRERINVRVVVVD
jgi:CSLREA domain-containing protein